MGNFATGNPSRPYLELLGDWVLQHRSEEELVRLATECGAARHQLRVGREPEGVNLFLHVRVPQAE